MTSYKLVVYLFQRVYFHSFRISTFPQKENIDTVIEFPTFSPLVIVIGPAQRGGSLALVLVRTCGKPSGKAAFFTYKYGHVASPDT